MYICVYVRMYLYIYIYKLTVMENRSQVNSVGLLRRVSHG